MNDYTTLRRRMVDNQIRPGDVTDNEVIKAFLFIPRETFVEPAEQPFAYADRELRLPAAQGHERGMMAPAQLARLTQMLPVNAQSKVLVIGCGTGYSAAILARLAGHVFAVEEDERLADLARERLAELGVTNVEVVRVRLTQGHPAEAPYDAILIDGAVETLPDSILAQLKPGRTLAVIERDGGVSRAMLYERIGADAAKWPKFEAWATLLPGFSRKREFVF